MRTHRAHPALMCWTQPELRDVITASTLCAARIEGELPPGASLDLMFAADHRVAVVPCVLVAGEELQQRENSPFLWPHATADLIDAEQAEHIERRLLPWIEALTLGRAFAGETVRMFGGGEQAALFEAARESRFLGAAPYQDVLADAAPYMHAARFASDALVAIRDARGSLGAAMLSRSAASLRADLQSDELNALARRWYCIGVFGTSGDRCDVSIAASPHAHCTDASVRISIEDGAAGARRFAVAFDAAPPLRAPAIARTQAVGGSSGRILLVVRDDWATRADADSDDASALAQQLRGEGFHVDVLGASDAAGARGYDLVHAFAAVNAAQLYPALRAARAAGIPAVLTPALEDVCAQGAWGTSIVPAALAIAHDETELSEHLRMLELRRLDAPGVSAQRQEPFDGYEHALRELLSGIDAVIVSGSLEEGLVRRLGCMVPAIHGAPHLTPCEPDSDWTAAAGTAPFVFVHAPIEPRNNQYLIVRAAMHAGLPVLMAGPVADTTYFQAVKRISGERVAFIGDVPPGTASALYRRARVYADLSWMPYGLARVAAAGASGCALVLARGGNAADLFGTSAWTADPCSVDSIALALGDAWMHAAEEREVASGAGRIAAWADPAAALRATVQAYAAAQQAKVHA